MSMGQLPSVGPKREKYTVFSIHECSKCNQQTKKSFEEGDYVYKEQEKCKECNGKIMITMIYVSISRMITVLSLWHRQL